MTDRRKHPRAETSLTAVVLARFNAGVLFTIESVSLGGARLVGPLTLEEGERVQILFDVDGRPLDVEAEVIRIISRSFESDRVAVRFIDPEPEVRASIRVMVQRALEHEEDHLVRGDD